MQWNNLTRQSQVLINYHYSQQYISLSDSMLLYPCVQTDSLHPHLKIIHRLVIRLVKELRVRYLQVRIQVDLVGALRVHTCSTPLTGQTALGTRTLDQVVLYFCTQLKLCYIIITCFSSINLVTNQ